ncbi:hypothetical protein F5B22DRAFT_645961 [Xylaria bambusicola]|uniref:uncharacterized protein n=1 Tax=Xylaria bambusicola TaxID=326684 RepID=UPI002008125D|nr:uncharacterized protein F5B22DRAFT_645961 [Xylaria bambusicola]KAI0517326.1 hypothetical protein F5B22DRAFT_645961 [Xylaria bambusicola]
MIRLEQLVACIHQRSDLHPHDSCKEDLTSHQHRSAAQSSNINALRVSARGSRFLIFQVRQEPNDKRLQLEGVFISWYFNLVPVKVPPNLPHAFSLSLPLVMVVQLPADALAAAVGVQVYSYICLLCSCLMILLAYKHRAKDSYISLLSCTIFVSVAASIAQQLHTIVLWEDIKTNQFHYVHDHLGSPELAIAGPSYGLDLVLFYIQYYCYNIEGILTLFWAFSLATSIFSPLGATTQDRISRRLNILSKALAFLLPATQIALLQIPAIKSSTPAFITLADLLLAISLTVGSILLVVIMFKYIQTRRRLHRWTIRYPIPRNLDETEGENGQNLDWDSDSENRIYDGWLIVRFTIAFVFLEIFQILSTLSELMQIRDNKEEVLPDEPDISANRARDDFVSFLPGVSAGLLVFLVFGTTKASKCTLYRMLFPCRFRRTTLTNTDNARAELDNQLGAFITSTSTRPTSEPTPSQIEEQSSLKITSYSEFKPAPPQIFRPQGKSPTEA